jgi:hypothetical protein
MLRCSATSSSEAEECDRDLPAEQDCIHIILPRRCCSSLSWNHTYDVAAHLVADENNQQTEVPTAVVEGLEDGKLANFALRLALTTHAGIPCENGIDALAEAEQNFAPPKPEKSAGKKKVATKKAAKKSTPVKAKSAKKKTTTKRLAA